MEDRNRTVPARYWRSQKMARASGADPVLFDLEEVEALAARCGKCEFGEQCLLWHLEAPDDAPGPPSYCLNREWIVATRAKQRG